MPVMTFLKTPYPYSGLRSAGKRLKPVARTTASTSTSSSSSRACRSMQPGTGQAFTHSSHSEQTAQSMQRRGALVGLRLGHRRLDLVEVVRRGVGGAVGRRGATRSAYALLAGHDLLLVHDRQPVVEAGHRAAGEPAVDHDARPAGPRRRRG